MPYSSSSITLTRAGGTVMANGNVKFDYSGQNNYTTVSNTIPEGFRPAHDQCVISFAQCGLSLLLSPSGSVQALGDPQSAYSTASGCWPTA